MLAVKPLVTAKSPPPPAGTFTVVVVTPSTPVIGTPLSDSTAAKISITSSNVFVKSTPSAVPSITVATSEIFPAFVATSISSSIVTSGAVSSEPLANVHTISLFVAVLGVNLPFKTSSSPIKPIASPLYVIS